MRIVEAGGYRVALCNVEGKFYAVEDVCTHDDGPLGDGTLKGRVLECPRHGGRFDVATGAAVRMPAIVPVRIFPTRVEGDQVFIEVEE
ncbi:MAG: non-heme iron oxygenase ferredoxin subunit [Elusimicrobia bacterium]|nr:non-heme iron oxygenase ferredoxin subunit [Elusimicrobiota bacterium]